MGIDPVCQMKVEMSSAGWKVEYKGKIYHFARPVTNALLKKDRKSI
jgi:YHS domain-containing protein